MIWATLHALISHCITIAHVPTSALLTSKVYRCDAHNAKNSAHRAISYYFSLAKDGHIDMAHD